VETGIVSCYLMFMYSLPSQDVCVWKIMLPSFNCQIFSSILWSITMGARRWWLVGCSY